MSETYTENGLRIVKLRRLVEIKKKVSSSLIEDPWHIVPSRGWIIDSEPYFFVFDSTFIRQKVVRGKKKLEENIGALVKTKKGIKSEISGLSTGKGERNVNLKKTEGWTSLPFI